MAAVAQTFAISPSGCRAARVRDSFDDVRGLTIGLRIRIGRRCGAYHGSGAYAERLRRVGCTAVPLGGVGLVRWPFVNLTTCVRRLVQFDRACNSVPRVDGNGGEVSVVSNGKSVSY